MPKPTPEEIAAAYGLHSLGAAHEDADEHVRSAGGKSLHAPPGHYTEVNRRRDGTCEARCTCGWINREPQP